MEHAITYAYQHCCKIAQYESKTALKMQWGLNEQDAVYGDNVTCFHLSISSTNE